MKWTDIDFKAKRIHIRRNAYKGEIQDLPKSNKPGKVVLLPQAELALAQLDRSTEWVFTTKTGKRFSDSNILHYWREAEGKFGRRVDRYEMRHFCGYYLYVIKGLRDFEVAEQLCHNDE